MSLSDSGFVTLGSVRLEYRMIGLRPDAAPTIVMLHEGLGCVGLWGDFPDRLAQATDCGVFVYSRTGYGQSSPVLLPRPLDYMQREARDVLPALLGTIGFQRGLLLGHSDGASIASIYAGSHEDHRLGGVMLMAPHFVVEDVSLSSIAEAKKAYETTDLRTKLSRWHADVDGAFRGWNDAWLDPGFRRWNISDTLAYIRVPLLVMQGADDQYGTVRQLGIAEEECYCPVDIALMDGVKHSPHREAPERALAIVADFTGRVLEANGWSRAD